MKSLVFIDLETTGLRPVNDIILEVGVVVTDEELNEIQADSWLVDPSSRSHALQRADSHVVEMHTKSGLLAALQSAEEKTPGLPKPWVVAAEVAQFIRDFAGEELTPMAGSSVHFDRSFIASNMPTLLDSFTHRNIDVSSIKELSKLWGTPYVPSGAIVHRALPDIRNTIEELRFYKGLWDR